VASGKSKGVTPQKRPALADELTIRSPAPATVADAEEVLDATPLAGDKQQRKRAKLFDGSPIKPFALAKSGRTLVSRMRNAFVPLKPQSSPAVSGSTSTAQRAVTPSAQIASGGRSTPSHWSARPPSTIKKPLASRAPVSLDFPPLNAASDKTSVTQVPKDSTESASNSEETLPPVPPPHSTAELLPLAQPSMFRRIASQLLPGKKHSFKKNKSSNVAK
jgi:hypothetical protein